MCFLFSMCVMLLVYPFKAGSRMCRNCSICKWGLAMVPQELATNFIWLKPVCRAFPQSVPGAMVLTDVFLYLDKLLQGTLLVKRDMEKTAQAGEEGSRVKRLMGSLRYLYRNSALTTIHTHGFTFLILFESNRIQHFKAKCFWVQMGYGFQNRPGESSLSPRVTVLKGYLQPSPRSAKASLLSSYMLRPYPKSNP